jgi:hypothetical protein
MKMGWNGVLAYMYRLLALALLLVCCTRSTTIELDASPPIRYDASKHPDAKMDAYTPPSCELAGSQTTTPPGVVIAHRAASTGEYVSSPTIIRAPDGALVATHDVPGHLPPTRPTLVYRSVDNGISWVQVASVEWLVWASLFEHKGNLYLLGTAGAYADVVIAKSTDSGFTWNTATIMPGSYATGTTPSVVQGGRIWHAIEVAVQPVTWPTSFEAAMLSAPIDSDLLDANSWSITNSVPNRAPFAQGWLEGNAVVTPAGDVADLLRMEVKQTPEYAALLVMHNGSLGSPSFSAMDGAAKKFVVRYDSGTKRYLTLVNTMEGSTGSPSFVRNHLTLASSLDLKTWEPHCVLLSHPDRFRHAFQYADWVIDGSDLIFVVRTAFDDGLSGASNFHDANFITFHRLKEYRGSF